MPTDAARIAEQIAGDFYGGRLDLSTRGVRSAPGWADMPEVACSQPSAVAMESKRRPCAGC